MGRNADDIYFKAPTSYHFYSGSYDFESLNFYDSKE